jgi:hypothetical protein
MAGDSPADDPWGFLPKRDALVPEGGPIEKRERGELRGEMGGSSLKRRAWPIALCLALVSVAGFLTEVVATSHLLSVSGPGSLAIVFPLGGAGLLLLGALQFQFVDQKERLPLLRLVTSGYAVVYAIAFALIVASIAESVATGAVILMGDQLNFLVPLLVWSLAGDEFNVAEGRKIFGWIVSWTYGGQILGLLLSVATPSVLSSLDIDVIWILVLAPVAVLFVGLWLPVALKDSAASTGLHREENALEAVKSAWDFIQGVPVWRAFVVSSVLTFVAGMTAFLAYLGGAERLLGDDPGSLQVHLGGVMLVSFTLCLLLQKFGAEKLQDKIGIPGVLLILPIATVVAGIAIAVGIALDSIWVILFGISLWLVPRWSVDENGRRGALALVPDERRTRVSFLVDLGPIALGLLVAAPLAAVGELTDLYWLVPILAGVIAITALPWSLRVRRDWEDSLLNWRLRRRKQNRIADF